MAPATAALSLSFSHTHTLSLPLSHTHTLSLSLSFSHHGLILMKGMGAHVKKTVRRRKDFLPQISDRAPISGAERNDRKP